MNGQIQVRRRRNFRKGILEFLKILNPKFANVFPSDIKDFCCLNL